MSNENKEQATQNPRVNKTNDLTEEQLQEVSGGARTPAGNLKTDERDDSRSTATDDVWVDGNIITAENYDSAY